MLVETLAEVFPTEYDEELVEGKEVLYDPEDPLAWQDWSACKGIDGDVFFVEQGGSTRRAKAICRDCIAAGACLDFAVFTNQRFGIWAGTTERDRRQIRKNLSLD